MLRLSDLTLLLVALVWGTSYGVAKGALDFYPVLGFLAVRFGFTFVLLLPALLRAPQEQQRDALRTGLPLGVLMLCIFVSETYGVAHTLASHAALLISLCVVLTPLAQWWLLGQRPQPGGLAHQQRAGLWRPVCDALAGGTFELGRLVRWRAHRVGRTLDHAAVQALRGATQS